MVKCVDALLFQYHKATFGFSGRHRIAFILLLLALCAGNLFIWFYSFNEYQNSQSNPAISFQDSISMYPNLDLLICDVNEEIISPLVGDPFTGPVLFVKNITTARIVDVVYPKPFNVTSIDPTIFCWWTTPPGLCPCWLFSWNEIDLLQPMVYTIRGFLKTSFYSTGTFFIWDSQTEAPPRYPFDSHALVFPQGWNWNNLYLHVQKHQFSNGSVRYQHQGRLELTSIYKVTPFRPPYKEASFYPLYPSLNYTFDISFTTYQIDRGIDIIKYEPVYGVTQLQSSIFAAFNISLTIFAIMFPIVPLVISVRTVRFGRQPQLLNPSSKKMIEEDEYFTLTRTEVDENYISLTTSTGEET